MAFDYHAVIQHYPLLLHGLALTVLITIVAAGSGLVIGIVVCAGSLSGSLLLAAPARGYVAFFRATPEMVLIFWVYFCAPPLFDLRLSAFWSGTLALSLVGGAYLGEIIRAGIQSLDAGQFEAAGALGLKAHQRWMLVILPQAVRRMTPAFMAYLTELLKNTALLSAIGVTELAYQAATLGAQTFRYIEFLTATALLFFILIYPVSLAVRWTEGALKLRPGSAES